MSINVEKSHKCIERSTKCDCPICGEYMFTSPEPVVFMQCGHSIHAVCFKEYSRVSYKCPICTKSIANMETQFRNLDRTIADQPMPEEYADTKAWVFCNDCHAKSWVMYHWLGLKCDVCDSYNTTQLQLTNGTEPGSPRLENVPTDDADLSTAILTAAIAAPLGSPMDTTTSPLPIPESNVLHRAPPHLSPSIARPSTSPPYLIPHHQGVARSVSPVVGNYFGLRRQEGNTRRESHSSQSHARQAHEGTTNGEDVDFWGRPFLTPNDTMEDEAAEEEDDDEEESSSDEEMEDDGLIDDDDEDHLDIFGHR